MWLVAQAPLNFWEFYMALNHLTKITGLTVAMVTYSGMKMKTTCWPIIAFLSDSVVVSSLHKEKVGCWSKHNFWPGLGTFASHLKSLIPRAFCQKWFFGHFGGFQARYRKGTCNTTACLSCHWHCVLRHFGSGVRRNQNLTYVFRLFDF